MSPLMLIINTATKPGFVLWNGKATTLPDQRLEDLLPTIEKVLGNLRPKSIGIVTGPGSFTSLRIGFSVARSLALAWSIPLIGVSIFDWMRDTTPRLAIEMRPGAWLVDEKLNLMSTEEIEAGHFVRFDPSHASSKSNLDALTAALKAGMINPEPLYGVPPKITSKL